MKKTVIGEHIFLYTFEDEIGNQNLNYNMVVLIHDKEVLLIDSGFRRHFNLLLSDLHNQGLQITHVITTHFHFDHIGGLSKLYGIESYGSKYSIQTLERYFDGKDYTKYIPKYLVERETIQFGDFTIDMESNPGHSLCGMLITINQKYLIVGDDIIYSRSNKPILPFCSAGDVSAHIKALENIRRYALNKYIIPSHGTIQLDNARNMEDINNRLKYLYFIETNPNKEYLDFYNQTGIKFLDLTKK